MISQRFTIQVAALLSVALIPSVIHNYLHLKHEDGLATSAIETRLDEFISAPSTRKEGWGEYTFESYDWFERDYRNNNQLVRLFTGRSYNHKKLYHHPELALSYGKDFRLEGIVNLSWHDRKIPVTVLRENSGTGLVAYALVYEHDFIENPIAHQIGTMLSQLVSPGKPLTLFYASDTQTKQSTPFEQTGAAKVLTAAIAGFFAETPGRTD